MLFREHSANENFSAGPDSGDEPSREDAVLRRPVPEAWSGVAVALAIAPGDEVVFDRLDLAEILGIWRHARGRVVGLHPQGDAATVDVQFAGHETLERCLPDLFRRAH